MIGVVSVAVWLAVLSVLGEAVPSHKLVKNADKRLYQQEQDLKELGCKPMLQKVPVKSLLDTQDPLLDEEFFPQTVAQKRCHEDCGFCGWHKKGVETERCVANLEKVEERLLVVFYFDHTNKRVGFVEVAAKEHQACMCTKLVAKEPPTSTLSPHTTQSPQTSTKSPQTTTQSPQPTTQAPQTTTQSPQPTTQAPQTSTQSPQTSTQSPQTTTQSPQPTTQSPQPTLQSPQTSTQSPRTST